MYILRSFDKYYIDINEGGDKFIETYSPRQATQFETEKEALEWANEYSGWGDRSFDCVKATDKLFNDFDEWAKTMTRRKVTKLDKSGKWDYDPSRHTVADVIQFFISHDDYSEVPFDSYITWPRLYNISSHIWSVKKYANDSFTFGFYFSPEDSSYDNFKEDFNLAMSFNPTAVDRDGELFFSVFDNYLSEGGNTVSLHKSGDEFVVKHRGTSEIVRGSLKDCYDYLLKHRFYE